MTLPKGTQAIIPTEDSRKRQWEKTPEELQKQYDQDYMTGWGSGAGRRMSADDAARRSDLAARGLYDLEGRTLDAEERLREQADRYAQTQADAQNRQASQIDYSQADVDRARQQAVGQQQSELGEYYKNMMAGNGPSVAEKQMQAGVEQSIAAQQASANSARGGSMAAAAAQRNAAFQGAVMRQNAVQQGATLRAQEQQQAAGAYGSLLSNQRASELQAQGMSADQAKAVADNEARQRALNDAQTQAYLAGERGATSDYNSELSSERNVLQGKATPEKKEDDGLGMIMSVGGGVIGALSDRRLKKDVRDVDGESIDAFLESLAAKRFEYRNAPPDVPEGERYGVIAQDVEKTPMGRSFVEHDERGMRYLDGGQGIGAILASLGRVNERLSAVERRSA